jgi:glycosyltransferase involved in cell wall biosynthesis
VPAWPILPCPTCCIDNQIDTQALDWHTLSREKSNFLSLFFARRTDAIVKILLVNYEFPPVGGGAGRATYHIACELIRLGHHVEVLTSRMPGEKVCESLNGFTVHRAISFRKNIHDCGFGGAISFVLFSIARFIKLSRENNYDVLHYFFSLPTGLLTFLPGRHRYSPSVVSLRGSDVPHYDPFNRPLEIAHKLFKPINRLIWRRASRVVALSHSLRDTAHLTNARQSIDVIPNGIDAQFFRPLVDRNQKTDAMQTLKLISVARLVERKGIQHILAAMAQIRDRRITLSIAGTGNYEGQLKSLCRKLELDEVVCFRGYCTSEQLVELYNAADVFILPSLRESFGMAFLEAMACGLPIIGGRTGGVPSIVSERNGLLVPPGDVAAIRDAIVKMYDDCEGRAVMAVDNREKVLQKFDWHRVARSYLEIYRCINGNAFTIDSPRTNQGGYPHD